MPDMAFAEQLGFTPAWFALGVVNDSVLAQLRVRWDKGEDPNTEHYRYRAFCDFLAAHQPLTPELAMSLFELGAHDQDSGMGGAIMAHIVYLPECPQGVLDAAMMSGRKHLIRAVEKRR